MGFSSSQKNNAERPHVAYFQLTAIIGQDFS